MKQGRILLTVVSAGLLGACNLVGTETETIVRVGDVVTTETEWSRQTKLTSRGTLADDFFGNAVDVDGEYAVAGSGSIGGTDTGGVFVFHRINESVWDSGARLRSVTNQANESFGASVSIDGDFLLAGAPLADVVSLNDEGTAFVYRRVGPNTWDDGSILSASDAASDDGFGTSVAISGDVAVVGAPYADGSAADTGAAYVFERTTNDPSLTNDWQEVAILTPASQSADDYFGYDVAIDGDIIVVGARFEGGDASNEGAAYVYRRDGNGQWNEVDRLDPSVDDSGHFGVSVAVDGTTIVVGASWSTQQAPDGGAVYVFEPIATDDWDEAAILTAFDAAEDDYFGHDVAIDGGRLVVGTQGEDGHGSNRGSIYLFTHSGSGTDALTAKITAWDDADTASFGEAVAIDGDLIIAGALSDDAELLNGGAAYIVYRR